MMTTSGLLWRLLNKRNDSLSVGPAINTVSRSVWFIATAVSNGVNPIRS